MSVPDSSTTAESPCSPSAYTSQPATDTATNQDTVPRRQTRLQKRLLDSLGTSTSSGTAPAAKQSKRVPRGTDTLQLSLVLHWHSNTGKVQVEQVQLKPIRDLTQLQGLSRKLVERAFPPSDRPEYLTSDAFCKYTPTREVMSLPNDLICTHFRLILTTEDGWEYAILERHIAGPPSDDQHNMLVTLIEFESTALMIGHLGVRISMVLYPLVSVSKVFLEDVAQRLKSDPEGFRGIL
ncbi:hypothetical protein WJX73_010922 [Symbiochloris irregularis]|uniref:Uncharacterized protein n=1 Tax=Symbiochloris irregularis TaxID=706552 RepID=A0AAW1PRK7_9CHLO